MLKTVINNKVITFIPRSAWVDDITYGETTLENDVFKKSQATLTCTGETIICSDPSKLQSFCRKIAAETYDDYLSTIDNYDIPDKKQWVYNILDGTAEQDKVVHRDDRLVIVKDYKWNGESSTDMHLLVFPIDRSLRTIRDLTASHLDLLKYIRQMVTQVINDLYGLEGDMLKLYIHYAPSTYHFHVHVAPIMNTDTASSVEYSHDLNMVIRNIELIGDYYQKIVMNRRI